MTQFNRSDERSPERIEFARDQRKTANEFAQDVWQMLRARRMLGLKFRREHPIGPYTVDFVCLSIRLVIEVDGQDHFTEEGKARDQRRDAFLRAQGWEVLRIEGFRVTQAPGEVRREIEAALNQRREEFNADAPLPQPLSPKRGEGSQREEAKRVLFTIGHSNRSPEEFLEMLKQNGVTAIADVRSQPYSRHMPHFNREPLQELLKENGIAYVFVGSLSRGGAAIWR